MKGEININNPSPGVYYYKKLPDWMRKKYFNTVEGICQLCGKKMLYKDMEIHRLKRKEPYTFCKLNHKDQNCMLVHSECHKKLHENEKGCNSYSY